MTNVRRLGMLLAIACSVGLFDVARAQERPIPPRNVLLIGWDGVQRDHLLEMLRAQRLPNLQALIDEGSLVFTEVTTAATHTKPGWVEILTGYNAVRLGTRTNKEYKPIPCGYTIFERLKAYFGFDSITTVFIGGKINNIGARGPHEICANCPGRDEGTRQKTFWWHKEQIKNTSRGIPSEQKWVKREGEPFYCAVKNIDIHTIGLGPAQIVGKTALQALQKIRSRPFFMFVHYEEPDEQGHVYGENSPRYEAALQEVDQWIGIFVRRLKNMKLYDATRIYVTSDHGFDEGGNEHHNAPWVFLATNSKQKLHNGDRKDVTPTLYEEYALPVDSLQPPLDGRSLVVR